MSGGELAVVLASVAVVVAVAVLGAVGVSLSRSLRELRRLMGEIRRDLLPAVERIEEASGRVTGEVQRVGGLLDVAEAVSERAESLSRATYRALVEPFAAVVSLFRRGDAGGLEEAAAPRPPRRAPWTRRATVYLVRSGYRTASARLAARLATAQAQRSTTTTTRSHRGATPEDPAANHATGGSRASSSTGRGGTAGRPSGRHLVDALREVTDEISAALEEGRRRVRAERRGEDRPK